jgi:hypothetical protein
MDEGRGIRTQVGDGLQVQFAWKRVNKPLETEMAALFSHKRFAAKAVWMSLGPGMSDLRHGSERVLWDRTGASGDGSPDENQRKHNVQETTCF